jgi:hypothetical protein
MGDHTTLDDLVHTHCVDQSHDGMISTPRFKGPDLLHVLALEPKLQPWGSMLAIDRRGGKL